jgi:hypothetical protein
MPKNAVKNCLSFSIPLLPRPCGNIKCPGNNANPAKKWAMQGRVRAFYDMLNGWLKNWGILSQVFHNHISMHGDVPRACAVLTQLTIENGEPLFEVEYRD